MELKREQIIKALECCTSGHSVSACMSGCPLYEKENCDCIYDDTALLKYALSLIKKLTEENERLKNSITFRVVMPDEKMEEIKAECIARVELDVKECRADTVRKMQERLTSFFANDDNLEYIEVDAKYINEQIDQIAKDILEGDKSG